MISGARTRRELAARRKTFRELAPVYGRIASYLRHRRLALGWSQMDLARAAGVSSSTISLIESGQNRCSLEVLLLIAPRLRVSPEHVIAIARKGDL